MLYICIDHSGSNIFIFCTVLKNETHKRCSHVFFLHYRGTILAPAHNFIVNKIHRAIYIIALSINLLWEAARAAAPIGSSLSTC